MNDFRDSVGKFQTAMRQEGQRGGTPAWQSILRRDHARRGLRLRFAFASVMLLVVGIVPVWRSVEQKREARDRADELLMEQVNASLSRGVPQAMAPLFEPVLIVNKESNQ
jgi:hypothetical protein